MSKRRQQMHGKTFGGIAWSHRPENHNMLRANGKIFASTVKAFRRLSVSAGRAAESFHRLSNLLSDPVWEGAE
ncbi:hypothetical protein E3T43_01205 [Cryobacterium sp. Hh7]|uniref:hypothetical protein n=1 Tax=Cryobacterium sp. Hh7 TaxID=1259159 RepID=UPI001069E0E6|nr:hypothetical protein [Cryobacterium sp. Hh7]TFD61118.1 hypothetical protein E3T43_01205 [Cryobacterium sp. Hh7]